MTIDFPITAWLALVIGLVAAVAAVWPRRRWRQ